MFLIYIIKHSIFIKTRYEWWGLSLTAIIWPTYSVQINLGFKKKRNLLFEKNTCQIVRRKVSPVVLEFNRLNLNSLYWNYCSWYHSGCCEIKANWFVCSQIGIQQHFNLGQLLRQRYVSTGFMNSSYSRYQVRTPFTGFMNSSYSRYQVRTPF